MGNSQRGYFFGCNSTCKNGECQFYHNGPCLSGGKQNIITNMTDKDAIDILTGRRNVTIRHDNKKNETSIMIERRNEAPFYAKIAGSLVGCFGLGYYFLRKIHR